MVRSTTTPYHLDITKAKALLAEAGYPDGFALKITAYNSSPDKEAAQAIQATFEQAGIKVELNAADRGQVTSLYRARQHEAVVGVVWSPDYLDVHSSAEFFTVNTDDSDGAATKNAAWRNHWLIPDLSAKTREGLLERNPENGLRFYLDLQTQVRDDSPIIVLYQETDRHQFVPTSTASILGPSWDTPVLLANRQEVATHWAAAEGRPMPSRTGKSGCSSSIAGLLPKQQLSVTEDADPTRWSRSAVPPPALQADWLQLPRTDERARSWS